MNRAIASMKLSVFGSHIVVKWRESRRILVPLKGFEIELAKIDPIPIETLQQTQHTGLGKARALRIHQIDQAAPVETGLHPRCGTLSTLRMIEPEALGTTETGWKPIPRDDNLAHSGRCHTHLGVISARRSLFQSAIVCMLSVVIDRHDHVVEMLACVE